MIAILFSLFLSIPVANVSHVQSGLTMSATLTDELTGKPIAGYVIITQADKATNSVIHADAEGVIRVELEYNEIHELLFIGGGYFQKKMILDLFNIPVKVQDSGYNLNFTLPLMHEVEGLPEYLLEEPQEFVAYSSAIQDFVFDQSLRNWRTRQIKSAIEALSGK